MPIYSAFGFRGNQQRNIRPLRRFTLATQACRIVHRDMGDNDGWPGPQDRHRRHPGDPEDVRPGFGCSPVAGGGGREFFKPEFSYPIEQGDIIGFARTVENSILAYEQDPELVLEKGMLAADFIRTVYSPELEEPEVAGAWQVILCGLCYHASEQIGRHTFVGAASAAKKFDVQGTVYVALGRNTRG